MLLIGKKTLRSKLLGRQLDFVRTKYLVFFRISQKLFLKQYKAWSPFNDQKT